MDTTTADFPHSSVTVLGIGGAGGRTVAALNRLTPPGRIRLLAVDAVRQLLCQIIASTAAFYFAVESVRIVRRKRKDFGQVHFVVIGK